MARKYKRKNKFLSEWDSFKDQINAIHKGGYGYYKVDENDKPISYIEDGRRLTLMQIEKILNSYKKHRELEGFSGDQEITHFNPEIFFEYKSILYETELKYISYIPSKKIQERIEKLKNIKKINKDTFTMNQQIELRVLLNIQGVCVATDNITKLIENFHPEIHWLEYNKVLTLHKKLRKFIKSTMVKRSCYKQEKQENLFE